MILLDKKEFNQRNSANIFLKIMDNISLAVGQTDARHANSFSLNRYKEIVSVSHFHLWTEHLEAV